MGSEKEKIESDTTEVRLDKIRIGIAQAIKLDEISLLEPKVTFFESERDPTSSQLIARLNGYLLGENLPDFDIEYPKDWWQAVKDRWFPGWFKKRWSVQYKKHHISFNVLYPDFRPQLPNENRKIKFLHRESEDEK